MRVELENPGQIFKIGMYVNVAFGALGTAEITVPFVPSAVQNITNQQMIFVATDNPSTFILEQSNGQYAVLEGLNLDNKIVIMLRAEWLKQHPAAQ